jgi:hypothetical protein
VGGLSKNEREALSRAGGDGGRLPLAPLVRCLELWLAMIGDDDWEGIRGLARQPKLLDSYNMFFQDGAVARFDAHRECVCVCVCVVDDDDDDKVCASCCSRKAKTRGSSSRCCGT